MSKQYRIDELYHHGIKGQKWGVRRYQNEDGSLTPEGKKRYAWDTDSEITKNKDGSYDIPEGFLFNRVGDKSMQVNKSGGLFVSYGKDDANRYVSIFGKMYVKTVNDFLEGNKKQEGGVQHIVAKEKMKLASNEETIKLSCDILYKNDKVRKEFGDSYFWEMIEPHMHNRGKVADPEHDVSKLTPDILQKAMKDENDRNRLAYGLSMMYGDAHYASTTRQVYKTFIEKGYDAIPDFNDTMIGTSSSAMVVINPDKLSMTAFTKIDRKVLKEATNYVSKLSQLPVNQLLNE